MQAHALTVYTGQMMKAPDVPKNEAKRLNALKSLNVLDSPSEERFDRITRIAKRMFDVPIALVSLVDENRQWFKSCIGLDATETSREISFCGHAILGDEIFVIQDTHKDSRFADNPLVTGDPFIRFYAGCPLTTAAGEAMGTLCIIDSKPRNLTADDFVVLKDLAITAESELRAVEIATMDELTYTLNKRGLKLIGQHSIELCVRQEIPATFIYFDLDNFKTINDNFGHAEGDKALVNFTHILKTQARNSDLFARLGGDEFACMLIDTALVEANEFVSRVQQSITDYNRHSNNNYDISFSYGMVEFDSTVFDSLEEHLAAADALMYENKKSKLG